MTITFDYSEYHGIADDRHLKVILSNEEIIIYRKDAGKFSMMELGIWVDIIKLCPNAKRAFYPITVDISSESIKNFYNMGNIVVHD